MLCSTEVNDSHSYSTFYLKSYNVNVYFSELEIPWEVLVGARGTISVG